MSDGTLNIVIGELKRQRFIIDNEKHLQEQIAMTLDEAGIQYLREYALDGNRDNIIDFYINQSIGIEVKIKAAKRQIYRQCVRYSNALELKQLILLSSTTMGMPERIGHVDIYFLNPSLAWL